MLHHVAILHTLRVYTLVVHVHDTRGVAGTVDGAECATALRVPASRVRQYEYRYMCTPVPSTDVSVLNCKCYYVLGS